MFGEGEGKEGRMKAIIRTELGLEKQCARCNEFWPLDFYNRRGNGLHSYCKACMTERRRELRHMTHKHDGVCH